MNRSSLAALAMSVLALPALAQSPQPPLTQLLEQTVATPARASLGERAGAFSALAALPANTDSFMAVTRLGELAMLAGGVEMAAQFPALALVGGLDSFALGVSSEAAADLQRLAPLFELLGQSQSAWVESWMNQAEPGAALAIVAQQRETLAACAEQLVQSTADFSLAPIYLVLTAKPEAQMLLHQASILPLMIPVEPGGPVELTAQGAWRGFCIRGNLVDLTEAGLDPEHESRLKANLEKVRVYVLARVVDNKLVLAITSDMSKVKLPSSADKSLLSTDKFNAFDSCVGRNPWAVGYTSPGLVNLCERLDLHGYQSVARFVSGVLRRLGPQNEGCARAAVSLDSLMQSLDSLIPPGKHAEQVMVWQDDAVYVRTVSDARGVEFAPGTMSSLPYSQAQDTIVFAESTPVRFTGGSVPSVPVVLDDLSMVLQGCRTTLQPRYAAGVEQHLKHLAEARPGLVKLAAGAEKLLSSAISGSTTLLVQEQPAETAHPVSFSLRTGVADAAALDEAGTMLQEGAQLLCGETKCCAEPLQVQRNAETLLLSSVAGGLELVAPSAAVPGGAVFSLQLAPMSRALDRAAVSCPDVRVNDAAETLRVGASLIERIDGAATTREGQLHTLLRVQPVQN